VPVTRRVGGAIRRTPLLAGLPREVAVLTVIAFFVALGFGILIPAIPVFARSFGVTALEASAVVSVFALVRFLTSPLAGALVDRMGERVVLTSGLLIVSLSSIAAGFSQTFTQLLVLRGVGGLGSSMFTVSAMALLLRVVDSSQRGRAAGAFQGGFLLGGVAGPAVGGLVTAWSIRAPFFVYAASLLVAAVVSGVMLSRTRLSAREERIAAAEAGESAGKLEQLRDALRNRAYQAALAVSLVTGFVVFGMRSSAVPLFVTEGMERSASLTGIGFLVAAALQAVLLLPAGRMADTQGRRKALVLGTWLLAVGMVGLTVTDIVTNGWGTQAVLATVLFLASMAIQGVSAAFLGSAPAAVVGDIMGGRRGGIVVATFQMMSDVGAVIGPLAAGLLIDKFDYDWAFGVGVLLAVLAALMVLRMPETLRPPQAERPPEAERPTAPPVEPA
jgi:MFS family permease